MRIELTDDRDVQHDGFVLAQLRAYNAELAINDFAALRVFARDAGGIIGGLPADTFCRNLMSIRRAFNRGIASALWKAELADALIHMA
ncbi:hypothetical protein CUJ91_18325 [Paraburkholderia graminis]|uniref:hypothetical protein n=1 Tax=Paraburkholderia graminis TaxID=60548 RepID=UPI000DEFF9B6|nr:hypothetical protein [Paraburkholderia graminis]AXF09978.1 hypothetical protein CUJ91_18325 [Paraburkholderia graminis]